MRTGWIVGLILAALVIYYGLIPLFFPNYEVEVRSKKGSAEVFEKTGDYPNYNACRAAVADRLDAEVKSGKITGWMCMRKPLPLVLI